MPDDLYRLPFSASPEAPRRCHSEFWYRRRRAHRIETRRTPCDAGSGAAAHHGRILVGPASLPDSLAAGGTPAILNQASFLGPERSGGKNLVLPIGWLANGRRSGEGVMGRVGIEPTTPSLKVRCSTTELTTHGAPIIAALREASQC